MSGRQQVIKIGEYYYVEDYNAGTSLALSTNIQNARWFDPSIPQYKERMGDICSNYGGVIRDLLDELQPNLTEVAE